MPRIVNEADVAEFIDAFHRDGANALRTFLANDYFEYVPGPDERPANEAIADEAQKVLEAVSGVSLQVSSVSSDDGQVTGQFVLTGTHAGVLWGAPATGRRVTLAGRFRARPVDNRFAINVEELGVPQVVAVLREFAIVNSADEMHRPPVHPVTIPDFVLKLLFTGRAGFRPCGHLQLATVFEPATRICRECVATGTNWPALRMCLVCGYVGCCDTATNKHMKAHTETTGHPIYRSIRYDEQWIWCVADGAFYEGVVLDALKAAAVGPAPLDRRSGHES